ncbi:MAG: GNAT family N-acetyltransferase [Eubacteriales bacterium]|nr:GNAT family N-acetyltransferase [Eubacteriales bacterium]
MIRAMEMQDYDEVYALWKTIRGFGLRSMDDSREGVERFLKRNPSTSIVAEEDGRIVGSILCGHDGRRGCFYHVCVDEKYRRRGIGKAMVVRAMEELRRENINKVCLIAFTRNDIGNAFWNTIGWTKREDLNYYDFTLNEANITAFNEQ